MSELGWIDNEGGTSYIQRSLADKHDPFEDAGPADEAARLKYGVIVPKPMRDNSWGWKMWWHVLARNWQRAWLVDRAVLNSLNSQEARGSGVTAIQSS